MSTIDTLKQLCTQLKLSALIKHVEYAIKEAQKHQPTYLSFIHRLLEKEWDLRVSRRTARYIKAAKFPQVKTLDSFLFSKATHLPEPLIRELMTGQYIKQAEPIILIGEPGTGKTHLASALGYAAAEMGVRVRFVTASHLANSLIEAKDAKELNRLHAYYNRFGLLIVDELGYLPLRKTDAELVFQVFSARQEQRPIIITTNLPFSEWTSIFPDPRLCRAIVDRLTHRAHIIETGTQSARLAEALEKQSIKKEYKHT